MGDTSVTGNTRLIHDTFVQEIESVTLNPDTQNKQNPDASLIIGKRFRVIEKLGQGTFGAVYKCEDMLLGNLTVAIKLFAPELFQNEETKARINRELQLAYTLRHQNIVQLIEAVRFPNYIGFTMEFVDGGTLYHYNLGEPVPAKEIIYIMRAIAQGLRAIHDAGVVHRDLKLENILLSKNGQIKISDFGVSGFVNTETDEEVSHVEELSMLQEAYTRLSRVTKPGAIVGTLDYIAPEYLTEAKFDERSDLYAVGVMLFELITGSSPYQDLNSAQLIGLKVNEPLRVPEEKAQDYPERLIQLCEYLCERDPQQRCQSCDELLTGLKDIAIQMSPLRLLSESIIQKKSPRKFLKVFPLIFSRQNFSGFCEPDKRKYFGFRMYSSPEFLVVVLAIGLLMTGVMQLFSRQTSVTTISAPQEALDTPREYRFFAPKDGTSSIINVRGVARQPGQKSGRNRTPKKIETSSGPVQKNRN